MTNLWRWVHVIDCEDSLSTFDTINVAYSGGLDSHVLLHKLANTKTLKHRLKAIHINHGLSPNAHLWEAHCKAVCEQLSVPFECLRISHLAGCNSNIEAKAREARYQVFAQLLSEPSCIVLGHHQDDQVETGLLQLFRGAGIDGLCGMPASRPLNNGNLIRPLLYCSQASLKQYALKHELKWVDDESNRNTDFRRNFLRLKIIPLLVKQWPALNRAVSRSMHLLQTVRPVVKDHYNKLVMQCMQTTGELNLAPLRSHPAPQQQTIIAHWLNYHGLNTPSERVTLQIQQSMIAAKHDTMPEIHLKGAVLKRYQSRLYLLKQPLPQPKLDTMAWLNINTPLQTPVGIVQLISNKLGPLGILDSDRVDVRFRQGGERIRLNGCEQQLKKLFQTWRVPPWQRPYIPLLFINDTLVAVIGFCVSDNLVPTTSSQRYSLHWQANTSEQSFAPL